jgi:hypothetical protein
VREDDDEAEELGRSWVIGVMRKKMGRAREETEGGHGRGVGGIDVPALLVEL